MGVHGDVMCVNCVNFTDVEISFQDIPMDHPIKLCKLYKWCKFTQFTQFTQFHGCRGNILRIIQINSVYTNTIGLGGIFCHDILGYSEIYTVYTISWGCMGM